MVEVADAVPSLVSVRRDLEQIDRAIVLLVAARIEAACSAIQLRSERGGDIADPAQEERVIARAQDWAEQVGLSPVLAEAIFRSVVEAGKDRFATLKRPLVSSTQPRKTGRARGRFPSRRIADALPRSSAPTPT